jgi:predicted ABC-type ATPase
MILIIHGPLGIGKTSLAWEALEQLESAAMLDGDYIGAVQPFDVYDPLRIENLYQAMALLAHFHKTHGVVDLVVNYVFETPEELERLKELLSPLDADIRVVRLVCSDPAEAEQRIRRRAACETGHDPEQEVQRYHQLYAIQEAAAKLGDMGRVVDTASKDLPALAHEVLSDK